MLDSPNGAFLLLARKQRQQPPWRRSIFDIRPYNHYEQMRDYERFCSAHYLYEERK
jgi:hypothetical protein